MKRQIWSRSPRGNLSHGVDVDTNDPIFVGGVDIQVAFHAIGLPGAFQDMFALDPIEAWEVDFARVVDQGIVESWNEAVYPVLGVVLIGWNQALNVCQWVHEHTAARVSGISAVVVVPPLSPLTHTEHVDNFVGLYNKKVWPRTRPSKFVTHWSKPACLFTPSLVPPRTRDFRPGVRSFEASWMGTGAFVLHCFMSHQWVGSMVGHFTFWALLSVRLTLSLNVGAVRDGGCGCSSFVNFGWQV